MIVFWFKMRISEGEDLLESFKDEVKDYEWVFILVFGFMKRYGFLSEVEDYVREVGVEVMSILGFLVELSVEVIEEFLLKVREFGFDFFIVMGGGSVIDMIKVFKVFYDVFEFVFEEIVFINCFLRLKFVLKLKIFFIVIFLMSGVGSEVFVVSVLKKNGIKYNIVMLEIVFEVVIFDLRFLRIMLREVVRNFGLDVFVYGIEVYIIKVVGFFSDVMVIRVIKIVFEWFLKLVEGDFEVRVRMYYVVMMVGIVFFNVRFGLVYVMRDRKSVV